MRVMIGAAFAAGLMLAGCSDKKAASAQADAVLCTSPAALARLDAWLASHPDAPQPARAALEPEAVPSQLLALLGAGG